MAATVPNPAYRYPSRLFTFLWRRFSRGWEHYARAHQPGIKSARRATLETIEPRILLSADLLPGASLSLSDADGTAVTYLLTGPGKGTVIPVEDETGTKSFRLFLEGTTNQSHLLAQADGGDGRFVIDAVRVEGSLGKLVAEAGRLSGAVEVDDNLGMLSLAGIADGVVKADSIGTLFVAADFSGGLTLRGAASGLTLSSAFVSGELSGAWNVIGRTGSLRAGSVSDGWFAAFGAPVTSITTQGDFAGTLYVPALQQLTVGGSLVGAEMFVGANLGVDGSVGGELAAADRYGPGNLNRARVTGEVVDSRIRVGVDPVNTVFDDGDDRILGSSRVQEFLVGGSVSGSSVVAGVLPPQIRVQGQLVPTSVGEGFGTTPVDRVVPILSASLAEDSGVSENDGLTNTTTIVGQVFDLGGVARISASLEGTFVDVSSSLQSDGSFVLDRAALEAVRGRPLDDGRYVLQLRAEDLSGNLSRPVQVAFELDTNAPEILTFDLAPTSSAGSPEERVTNAESVVLVGRAEGGAMLDILGSTAIALAGQGGVFQFANVSLALGENPFTLRATDRAGNRSQRSAVFTRVTETVSDAALEWNAAALEAVKRDGALPAYATRALAMTSLAIYDVVSAIDGTPGFYSNTQAAAGTSVKVAIAQAARDILAYVFGAQTQVFDAMLADGLASESDVAARDAGVALGRRIAETIIAIRAQDGWKDFADYPGSIEIGKWRPTGPMFDVAQLPQWADLTPFAMLSHDAFRPDAPPSLDSSAYAAAVEEIRLLGRADSTTRTAEQTQIARFWADGAGTYTPPGHWNDIALQIASRQGNSLTANARLFAMLNVALADASIAAWDAKYEYGFWRPETAIASAAGDGNDATTFEANWRPLLLTPNHPEYPSGHSTYSGAAAGILDEVFGSNVGFTTGSVGLPGVTRTFESFDQAAREAGRSRIYGGIHFEFTNQASLAVGREVAANTLARFELAADTQAPVVLLDPTPVATNGNITLRGTVLDSLSGVASLTVAMNDSTPVVLSVDEEGRFAFMTTLPLDGSADGIHRYVFRATDVLGNVAPPLSIDVALDTRAPTVNLESVATGVTLDVASRLVGTVDPTGSTLTKLTWRVDDGRDVPISFDVLSGRFDLPFDLSGVSPGRHSLTLAARDSAGNAGSTEVEFVVADWIPFTITNATPDDGALDVGVTFRPRVNFSRPVDVSTLTTDTFFATDSAGMNLAANVVPSQDGRFAWLFFERPLPSASTITLQLLGDQIRARDDGRLLDGDGDRVAGGSFASTFTTVSRTAIPGTTIVGKVVDPGADQKPMTFDDVRAGPDGVLHTPDDVFLNPIAGAKVYILGMEDIVVFTDASGQFTLDRVPVGEVKLVVDGRTATSPPAGVFFPEMTLAVQVLAGQTNTVMGGMGTVEEQEANTGREEVYLPRVQKSILQTIDTESPTTISVPPSAGLNLTDEQRQQLTLTVQAGSIIGEDGKPIQNAQIGISTVPPELVRDMLPPGLLQHTFDITIQAPGAVAFDIPLQLTSPNVFNAAPGTKLDFLSFDHTTGRLVIEGSGTVSDDGKTVTTDPGTGITKPGWHGWTPPGGCGESGGPPPPPPPSKPKNETLSPVFVPLQLILGESGQINIVDIKAPSKLDDTPPPPPGDPNCPTPPRPDDPQGKKQPFVDVTVEIDGPLSEFIRSTGNIDLSPGKKPTYRLSAGSGDAIQLRGEVKKYSEIRGVSSLSSVTKDILYGSSIKVTQVTGKPDGTTTTQSTTYYLYRLIDVADADHQDGMLEFADTLAGSRSREIELRAGTLTPAFVASGAAFSVSGNVVKFSPPLAGQNQSGMLTWTSHTSTGESVPGGSILLRGDGESEQFWHIDKTGFVNELEAWFPSMTEEYKKMFGDSVSEGGYSFSKKKASVFVNSVVETSASRLQMFTGHWTRSDVLGKDMIRVVIKPSFRDPGVFGYAVSGVDDEGSRESNKEFTTKAINSAVQQQRYGIPELNFRLSEALNESASGEAEVYISAHFAEQRTENALRLEFVDTIVHEMGHLLGLRHTTQIDPPPRSDVMSYGPTTGGETFSITAEAAKIALGYVLSNDELAKAVNYYVNYWVSGGGKGETDVDGNSEESPPIDDGVLILTGLDGKLLLGSIDLGEVVGGARIPISLTNVGDQVLKLGPVGIGGTGAGVLLSASEMDRALDPGESTRVFIEISEQFAGDILGSLRIASDGVRQLLDLPLKGVAVSKAPRVDLKVVNNNLGGSVAGDAITRDEVFSVRNLGQESLGILGIKVIEGEEDFSLTGVPVDLVRNPLYLATNESLDVGALFLPTDTGLRRAIVEVTTTDATRPLMRIALLGTGLPEVAYPQWGNDYVAVRTDPTAGGAPLLARSDAKGNFQFFLPSDRNYEISVFDPVTGLIGKSVGQTSPPGQGTDLTKNLVFNASIAADLDFDGLPDDIEFAIGTTTASGDTDRDGLTDFAEIEQGLDPLRYTYWPEGVVAAVATQGEANAVTVISSGATGLLQRAYVATGSYGLAILDISASVPPSVLSELELPGSATDVAVDSALGVAVVATGSGGLQIVDIRDSVTPILKQTIPVAATQVEVHDGIAYANDGKHLIVVDLSNGVIVQSLELDGAAVQGIARDNEDLYALDESDVLTTFAISSGLLKAEGTIQLAQAAGSVFVADGVAYVPVGSGALGGISTVDVSDPSNPVLISGPDNGFRIAGSRLALNGSGLGTVIGTPSDGLHAIDVMDMSNPSSTGRFVRRIQLPESPNDIAIIGGLAYVADGVSGLQVVRYVDIDRRGNAPTVRLSGLPSDLDSDLPGLQLEAGQFISVEARPSDDYQVRKLELLLNGRVVATDLTYSWDLTAFLPTIEENGGSDRVTLSVRATDTGGNVGMSEEVVVQLVGDTRGPKLVETNVPESGEVGRNFGLVRLTFSESIGPDALADGTVELVGVSGAVAPQSATLKLQGKVLELAFDKLALGDYELRIDGTRVKDLAGNSMEGGVIVQRFRVGDFSSVWVGGSTGFWDDSSAWSDGRRPGQSDDVLIPDGSTVEYRSGLSGIASLTSRGSLILSGGTLDIANTSSIGGEFTLAGGTLSGEGEVMLEGTSSWTHGVMSGTGQTLVMGSLSLDAQGAHTIGLDGGRALVNRGQMYWRNGNVDLNAGAAVGGGRVINDGAGVLEISSNASVDASIRGTRDGNVGVVFENRGVVRKVDVASNVGFAVDYRSSGTTDVLAGSIDFLGGVHQLGGPLTVGPNARVRVVGGNVELGSSILEADNLDLVSGKLSINTNVSVKHYLQSAGVLSGTGALTVSDQFQWTGGIMRGPGRTIVSGEVSIGSSTGGQVLGLDGRREFENRGTGLWLGGKFDLNAGSDPGSGVFRNALGATMEVVGGETMFASNRSPSDSGKDAKFENLGTVTFTGEVGIQTVKGFLDTPGQVNTYTFTLDRSSTLFLDGSFDANGSWFNWSLEKPDGTFLTGNTRYDSNSFDERLGFDSPLMHLEAGNYKLYVESFSDTTGWYNFRLMDLLNSSAETIALDQTASGQLNPGFTSKLYRFEAQEGQNVGIFLETPSLPSNAFGFQIARWWLVDPQGKLALSGTESGGTLNYGVEQSRRIYESGTWTILMQGREQQDIAWGPVDYSLSVDLKENNDPLPDLVVTQVESQVVGFNEIEVTWTTENRGTSYASGRFGSWTEAVWASADDTPFNGDDVFLGRTSVTQALESGQSRQNSLTLALPSGLPAGYRIYVVTDSDDGFSGGNAVLERAGGEYNNTTMEDVPSGEALAPLPASGPTLSLPRAEVGGSIDVAGEVDVYNLSLSSAKRVYFDSLTENADLIWTLRDGAGQIVVSRSFAASDAFGLGNTNPIMSLGAGTFELSVTGVGDQTGGYAFRLLDIDAVASDQLRFNGDPLLDGVLARGDETAVYQFEGTAGVRYLFGGPGDQAIEGSVHWRLIDPSGQQIYATDVEPSPISTFALSGTYTLLVEGRIGRTDPTPYNAYVFTPDDRTEALEVGGSVRGFLDVPGQVNTYTFTLDKASTLFLDGSFDSNGNGFNWSLEKPDGTFLTGNTRYDSISFDERLGFDSPLMHLEAGNYKLYVESFSDATGWYNFRLIDLLDSPAEMVALDQSVFGLLDPGFTSTLYRFEAQEGQNLGIFMQTPELPFNDVIGMARWWLLDPEGKLALSGSESAGYVNSENNQGRRIYDSGIWTILLQGREGQPGAWQAVPYQLVLDVQESDAFPDLVVTQVESQVVGLSEIEVTWTTENRGTFLASGRFGTWAEAVWASADDTPFNGDDFFLGSTSVTQALLEPGQSRQNSLTLALPAGLPSGYRIYVVTDSSDGFSGGNAVRERAGGEYNNTTMEEVSSGVVLAPLPASGPTLSLPRAEVGGSIDVAGEVDVYDLSLGSAKRVYFDSLTDNADLIWTLRDGAGQIVASRSFAASDAFGLGHINPIMSLGAGTFELSVTGAGIQTGAYAFRLLDVDAVASDQLQFNGEWLRDGVLARGDETAVYQFEGTAGVRYVFGGPGDQAIEGSVHWRLIDPNGQQIYATDVEPSPISTFALSGRYTVLVEGRIGRTDPTPYTVYVFGDKEEALTLGERVDDLLILPGQVNTYTFTLDRDSTLFLDGGSFDANGSGFVWYLAKPDGTFITGNTRYDSNTFDERLGFDSPLMHLEAGNYKLYVESFSDTTGWYNFRLMDLLNSSAETIALDQTASGQLNPGFTSKLYRFEAQEGQNVGISLETPNWPPNAFGFQIARWWLVDPQGKLALSGTESGGNLNYAVERSRRIYESGTWTILVQGRERQDFSWEPVDYNLSVDLKENNDPLPDLVVTQVESQVVGFNEIEVTWTTENRGTGVARSLYGTWSEAVWASADDTPFNGDDVFLGRTSVTQALESGQSRQNSLTLALPSGLPAGYRIYVVTDSDDGFSGGNAVLERAGGEYNNTTMEDVPSGEALAPLPASGPTLSLPRAEVGGSIDVAGEVDVYNLSLSSAKRIYFDSLTDDADLIWTLRDGAGQIVVSRTFAASDAFGLGDTNPVLSLGAGTFELSVSGVGDQTGGYAFRLLDIDAVASGQLQFNAEPLLDGVLTRGDETAVYQFEGTAGVRYLFGGPGDQAIEGSVHWRLIDPSGQQIYATDVEPSPISTFALSGTYTLLVEGRIGRTDPTPFNMYVFSPGDRSEELSVGRSGMATIEVAFSNLGVIQVNSGTLQVVNPVLSTGTVEVAAGATLILASETIQGPYKSPSRARETRAELATESVSFAMVGLPKEMKSGATPRESSIIAGLPLHSDIVNWRRPVSEGLRALRW